MEDTVTLARQEREKQGLWEAEVSFGGEADLHKHLTGCQKNPGHTNFIPVDQFNMEHLQPGCHDSDLVDMVRAMSDLTVRLSVKYVSDRRPEYFPDLDKPFPCYKARGRNMMRTGTGWVRNVVIYPNKNDTPYTTCKCKECVNSPTPKTQFAHIHMLTAAHVVYDDLEADHTTCHLFFDKGNSPEVCSSIVTLSGVSLVWCELENDCCYLRHTTHDLDLADRLNKILTHYKDLSKNMGCKYYTSQSTEPDLAEDECLQPDTVNQTTSDNIETIIVSHPHGCSKQITIGRYSDLEEREDEMHNYTYSAPTCPGSSGAHVMAIGKLGKFGMLEGYVHCEGQGEGSQQLNFSNYGHCIE